MQKLSALGKSAAEIAKVEGVAVKTVHNNLSLARKEASPIANAIREDADGELRGLLAFIKQSEEMTDAELVREVRATWEYLRELDVPMNEARALLVTSVGLNLILCTWKSGKSCLTSEMGIGRKRCY